VKWCEVIHFLVLHRVYRADSQTVASYPAGDAFIAPRRVSHAAGKSVANAPAMHFPASALCRRSLSTLFIDIALVKS